MQKSSKGRGNYIVAGSVSNTSTNLTSRVAPVLGTPNADGRLAKPASCESAGPWEITMGQQVEVGDLLPALARLLVSLDRDMHT